MEATKPSHRQESGACWDSAPQRGRSTAMDRAMVTHEDTVCRLEKAKQHLRKYKSDFARTRDAGGRRSVGKKCHWRSCTSHHYYEYLYHCSNDRHRSILTRAWTSLMDASPNNASSAFQCEWSLLPLLGSGFFDFRPDALSVLLFSFLERQGQCAGIALALRPMSPGMNRPPWPTARCCERQIVGQLHSRRCMQSCLVGSELAQTLYL